MKIRTGFVSNSSSSSFVIAIKEGTKQKEIKKVLLDKYKNDIADFCKDDLEYCYSYKSLQEERIEQGILPLKGKELYEDIANIIAEELVSLISGDYASVIGIGGWSVSASECGNEGENVLGLFLYNHANIDSEIVKTKTTTY